MFTLPSFHLIYISNLENLDGIEVQLWKIYVKKTQNLAW